MKRADSCVSSTGNAINIRGRAMNRYSRLFVPAAMAMLLAGPASAQLLGGGGGHVGGGVGGAVGGAVGGLPGGIGNPVGGIGNTAGNTVGGMLGSGSALGSGPLGG